MATLLGKIYDEQNRLISFSTTEIYDRATKQTMDAFITKMEALKVTVDAFLTGEDNANEVIDRLSEIVAAIKENKDLIDTAVNGSLKPDDIINDLTTGGATKVLSAEQGKALKALIDQIHVFANQSVLDKFSESAEGKLLYNGSTLEGATGIAYGTTVGDANDFSGKMKIVLEEITE